MEIRKLHLQKQSQHGKHLWKRYLQPFQVKNQHRSPYMWRRQIRKHVSRKTDATIQRKFTSAPTRLRSRLSLRSEERRVGKECRSRGSGTEEKRKNRNAERWGARRTARRHRQQMRQRQAEGDS